MNPAAFAQPALGAFGNAGRNAYVGMGTRVVDLSLVRAFRIASSHRLEGRLEDINAFNWFRPSPAGSTQATGVNATSPVTNLNNANFGRYLASDEPRILQFAVKYQF